MRCSTALLFFVSGALNHQSWAKTLVEDGCTIDLRQDSNLPPIAPILTSYHSEWILPAADAKITLESGSVMKISCPGVGFQHADLSASQFWTTKCLAGREFFVEGLNSVFAYSDLGCQNWPSQAIEEKGSDCGPEGAAGKLIEIGFPVSETGPTKVLITSCLDLITYQSIWSRHEVPAQIDQRNYYGDMPYFDDDGLYEFELDVYEYYTKKMQRETLGELLGSQDLADQYVEQSGDIYMARGHLAPKADFMYTSWQRATYHYVNAQAQWQIFNAGNWLSIEDELRNFASRKGKSLLVVTGTHGMMELDDVNGNKKEIFLNMERPGIARLPVPRFFWKLVVDEGENSGVVIIGVNNPHLLEVSQYRLCDEVLSDHPLLSLVQDANDAKRGVVYACEVLEAQKRIPEIPTDIGPITGILT